MKKNWWKLAVLLLSLVPFVFTTYNTILIIIAGKTDVLVKWFNNGGGFWYILLTINIICLLHEVQKNKKNNQTKNTG